jgi:transposase
MKSAPTNFSDTTGPAADPGLGLPGTLAECHVLIGHLQTQLLTLQERVNQNSNNSSNPPSSNGPGKRSGVSSRKPSTRKRGAQAGHKGSARALLDEALLDEVIPCFPPAACDCGQALQLEQDRIRHQVFEVPKVQPRVSEYQLHSARCAGCGKAHRGVLPRGVPRGQLGPKALALVGVLGTRYHLPQRKSQNFLADVLGIRFSVGAVSQAQGKVAQALQGPSNEISQACKLANTAKQIDETRYPCPDQNQWVWVLVTPKMVSYQVLPSRARYVAQSMLGEQPLGVIGSDRYGVYNYVHSTRRQVCSAHWLRDFRRISERTGAARQIGASVLGMGHVMFRWRHPKRAPQAFAKLQERIKKRLNQGAQQTQCTKTQATCQNLLKLWPALWTFFDHQDVQPTNNAAEQALRTVMIKRKISGTVQSARGCDFLARGFSVSQTCLRQGRHLWDDMHKAVVSWIDQTPAPSLVPEPQPSG